MKNRVTRRQALVTTVATVAAGAIPLAIANAHQRPPETVEALARCTAMVLDALRSMPVLERFLILEHARMNCRPIGQMYTARNPVIVELATERYEIWREGLRQLRALVADDLPPGLSLDNTLPPPAWPRG